MPVHVDTPVTPDLDLIFSANMYVKMDAAWMRGAWRLDRWDRRGRNVALGE